MQLYWPHLIAVTHTTATILAKSKIVALECAALYVAPIGGATHSSATILPFLPLLVLFWIHNPNQMLKNINFISVWQFWLNKVGSNVSLRHLNWWLKIKSFNLDLLSLCPSKILAVVRVTNDFYSTRVHASKKLRWRMMEMHREQTIQSPWLWLGGEGGVPLLSDTPHSGTHPITFSVS